MTLGCISSPERGSQEASPALPPPTPPTSGLCQSSQVLTPLQEASPRG